VTKKSKDDRVYGGNTPRRTKQTLNTDAPQPPVKPADSRQSVEPKEKQ
jgi:hypothetical protein